MPGIQLINATPPILGLHRDSSVPRLEKYMKPQTVFYPVAGKQISYIRIGCEGLKRSERKKEIDDDTQEVFEKIIEGNAQELLRQEPGCACNNNQEMGRCIFYFGNLMECSCDTLNRKNTDTREPYEEDVLKAVRKLIRNKSEICLTFLASGLLFSEFSVLIQVLNLLKEKKWEGRLRLNFIDPNYTLLQSKPQGVIELQQQIDAFEREKKECTETLTQLALFTTAAGAIAAGSGYVATKSKSKTLPVAVAAFSGGGALYGGYKMWECYQQLNQIEVEQKERVSLQNRLKTVKLKEKIDLAALQIARLTRTNTNEVLADTRSSQALPDFMNYLLAALPRKIKLTAQFFSTAQDYMELVKTKPKFKNDLLMGSDMDDSASDQSLLRDHTQTPEGQIAFLNRDGRHGPVHASLETATKKNLSKQTAVKIHKQARSQPLRPA